MVVRAVVQRLDCHGLPQRADRALEVVGLSRARLRCVSSRPAWGLLAWGSSPAWLAVSLERCCHSRARR